MPLDPPDLPTCDMPDDTAHLVTVHFCECGCDGCDEQAGADLQPEDDGWIATCQFRQCTFVVWSPLNRREALWSYAEQHETDPTFGLDVEDLPTDYQAARPSP